MSDFMALLAGAVLAIMFYDASLPMHDAEIIASRAAIRKCEAKLPRDKKCEIVAIIKEDDK